MAKRKLNISAELFPAIPLKYKDVPLTNGEGQGLVACKHCRGQGALATASKTIEMHNKAPFVETVRIPPAEEGKWRKKGFNVVVEPCQPCNGAGLIVSN